MKDEISAFCSKNPWVENYALFCAIKEKNALLPWYEWEDDLKLRNKDALEKAKAPYVPESGVVLPVTTVEFTPGETVFQVLQRVCKAAQLQLEYSWTPIYDSYYIEGINHLYEFDCGPESGWMYKVNGRFPNYGCSAYELQGGEEIVWVYTCEGLGTDVGAERMN
jgi:hypothetical protein